MIGGDLAVAMPAVARALLGDPVARLSTATEWRYGRRGSLAIDVERGLWRDHEAGTGGGVVALIRRERGGKAADALRWLNGADDFLKQAAVARTPARLPHKRPDEAERRAYALAIWSRAASPGGSPVEAYLASRALSLETLGGAPGERIRYADQCPFGRGVRVPAMLALLTDIASGEPVGIRRTALTTAGERARDGEGAKLPHKTLGRAGNAVARLGGAVEPPRALALCEGLETGLSVAAATGCTVWACPAGMLARLPVLPGVEALTIYADNDAPGLAAARITARRWADAGRPAAIEYPSRAGADFNDIWKDRHNA